MPRPTRVRVSPKASFRNASLACVTRTPVWSTYRWEGEVLEEEEHTLTIKTAEHSVAACKKRLLELHPYEVPEILVVPVDAERSLDAYVRWVREECLPDS